MSDQIVDMLMSVQRNYVPAEQLEAERARAETYKQQAIVNGKRRDMERVMRETAERERDAAVKARLDWQADYERDRALWWAQRDDARAHAKAAEGREARLREEHRDCRLALEFRDGVSCGGVRRDGVCHNHTIIAAMRKHAEDADRFELALRAAQGIIHEGLHGGKPTDPDHQAQCEKPACRHIRAALAGTPEVEPAGGLGGGWSGRRDA